MIHSRPQNILFTFAFLPVFTLSVSLPFLNQDQSWPALFRQTKILYQQGNYKKAFKVGNQAFTVARDDFQANDSRLAETEYLLGEISYALGRFGTASELYHSAVLIRKQPGIPEGLALADCLERLADIDCDSRRYQSALEAYRQAQAIDQKLLGADHPGVARLWAGIARSEAGLGRNSEAEPHIRQAVSSLEKALDPGSPDLALALSIQSQVELNLNRVDQAVAINERALAILKKAGGKSAALGWALYQQGEIDKQLGKYGSAEADYKQAVSLLGKYLDRNHPRVAMALTGWGETLVAEKKYSKALPYYQKARRIQAAALGPEDLVIAGTTFNQGEVQNILGRYRNAEPLYYQALNIRGRFLGLDSPEVAVCQVNLAEIYKVSGRDVDARTYAETALKTTTGQDDPDNVLTGAALNLLARLEIDRGDLAAAQKDLDRALNIAKKFYNPDRPEMAKYVATQAKLALAMGQYQSAEAFFASCLPGLEKYYGPNHPYVGMILEDQLEWAERLGKTAIIAKLTKQLKKIRSQKNGRV